MDFIWKGWGTGKWRIGSRRFRLIRYYAVRDADGEFLGTLEVTQDIAPIRALVDDVLSPIPDLTASVEYKKKLSRTLVRRVAARAFEIAKGAQAGGRRA